MRTNCNALPCSYCCVWCVSFHRNTNETQRNIVQQAPGTGGLKSHVPNRRGSARPCCFSTIKPLINPPMQEEACELVLPSPQGHQSLVWASNGEFERARFIIYNTEYIYINQRLYRTSYRRRRTESGLGYDSLDPIWTIWIRYQLSSTTWCFLSGCLLVQQEMRENQMVGLVHTFCLCYSLQQMFFLCFVFPLSTIRHERFLYLYFLREVVVEVIKFYDYFCKNVYIILQ